MNRQLASWIVLCVLAAARVGAEPGGVEDIVHRLQERYDSTSDFTADFAQEVDVPTLGRTLQSNGRVFFKRPGRMRWEFLAPEKQTIVADGERLWVYQPEQHQVLKAPFRAAFRSTTPLSFLFGVGRLEKDFRATLLEPVGETIRLRLEPREDTEIGTLVLTVDRDNLDLRGAEVTDPLGNVTRLEFTSLRREVGLDDSQFTFTVPEGADVVETSAALDGEEVKD